jgi:putative nucleotidyltransferase with HDIG domain
MRILVVEDEEPVASFLKQGLESDKYAVDVAYDGEQAQSLYDEADFDLVILDSLLPKADGFEVLNHIHTRKPSLPVLMISGWADVEDRVKGLDLGASDYLAKPFSFSELSARVRALLRRSPDSPDTVLQFEEYRRRFEQMKLVLGLPPTFGFLVEADGPYPRGHAQAVSWLAMQIAKQVGLSQEEIEEIRLAGLLHDIGKLHVPLHILDKPESLTAAEFETMKSHAAMGERMLEPFKVKGIGRIVGHHHERYDGKGYPDGWVGDKIPLGARIVAVAEGFEDMVSERSYKNARTFEGTLAEFRSCSGTQFDPKVVTTFLGWLQIYGDPREQQWQWGRAAFGEIDEGCLPRRG